MLKMMNVFSSIVSDKYKPWSYCFYSGQRKLDSDGDRMNGPYQTVGLYQTCILDNSARTCVMDKEGVRKDNVCT